MGDSIGWKYRPVDITVGIAGELYVTAGSRCSWTYAPSVNANYATCSLGEVLVIRSEIMPNSSLSSNINEQSTVQASSIIKASSLVSVESSAKIPNSLNSSLSKNINEQSTEQASSINKASSLVFVESSAKIQNSLCNFIGCYVWCIIFAMYWCTINTL